MGNLKIALATDASSRKQIVGQKNGKLGTIEFIPKLVQDEASDIFNELKEAINWEQMVHDGGNRTRQSQKTPLPRQTHWYGPREYTYSDIRHSADNDPPEIVETLRNLLQMYTGYTLNSTMCNLYVNHKNKVDWHADDEPMILNAPIVSLSFGASRTMEFKIRDSTNDSQITKILLGNGDVIVMGQDTQQILVHRIRQEEESCGERINLTFRLC